MSVTATQSHSIQVGQIIVNNWGYEQTNIDFYQVVKVSAKFVSLRRIGETTSGETGFMTGTKMPTPNQFASDEIKRHSARGEYVKFEYGCGKVWNGLPQQYSWYA